MRRTAGNVGPASDTSSASPEGGGVTVTVWGMRTLVLLRADHPGSLSATGSMTGPDLGSRHGLGLWARATGGRLCPGGRPPKSTGHQGHFFSPPTDVSLFCPGEHLPVGLVSGFPLPGPTSTAADATPLAANAIAVVSNAMRFFICFHPPSSSRVR